MSSRGDDHAHKVGHLNIIRSVRQTSQTSTPARGRLEADNVGKVSSLSRAVGPARPSQPHHKAHQKHLSAVTHAHTHTRTCGKGDR